MNVRRRDSGVSLMELMIAMGIMVLALLALMSSVFSSSRLVDNSKEKTLAYEAARAKIEEMRNYSLTPTQTFSELFNTYRIKTPTANPNNPVSVPGLNPIKINGVAQPVLQIYFPVTASGDLSENPSSKDMPAEIITALGMPKDLNRSGNTTDSGVALDTTYKILPVFIRVQWQSIGGRQAKIEVSTFISDK